MRSKRLIAGAVFVFVCLAWGRCATAAADASASLRRGRAALSAGDYGSAEEQFSEAVRLDPETKASVGTAWRDAGKRAIDAGNAERAAALFSKAFYNDPTLGPEVGRLLLAAAATIPEEEARARLVVRATVWSGAEAVLEATAAYLEKTLGPPRRVYLEYPGWVELAKVKPGDELIYLSAQQIRQRDGATVRLLPASVESPVRYIFVSEDMGGASESQVSLARDRYPAKICVWLIPWSGRSSP